MVCAQHHLVLGLGPMRPVWGRKGVQACCKLEGEEVMMKAGFQNKLPQEGTTKGGESLPESNSGCPTYSGGGKNVHRDSDTEEVGSQASSVPKTTGPDDLGAITDTDFIYGDEPRGSETRAARARGKKNNRRGSRVPVRGGSSSDRGALGGAGLDGSIISDRGMASAGSTNSVATLHSVSYEEDRLWAKRRRSPDASCSAFSTDEEGVRRAHRAKRGKGRPATSTQASVTRQAYLRAQRRDLGSDRSDLERSNVPPRSEEERTSAPLPPPPAPGVFAPLNGTETAAALGRRIEAGLASINEVRTKSRNLKGVFVRDLKEASDVIREAAGLLQERTMTEEARRLQAANDRLQVELDGLRKEVAELKAAQSAGPSGGNADLIKEIMRQVGEMVSARLEDISDRLLPERRLRPPLAADRRALEREKGPAPAESFPPLPAARIPASRSRAAPPRTEPVPRAAENQSTMGALPSQGGSKKKGGKKKNHTDKEAGANAPSDVTTSQQRSDEGWTVVGKRNRKKKKRNVRQTRKVRKLWVPSTSAVVIAIQPGAEDRGISFASVLKEAKAKIDLAEIGISAVRFKRSATGARILEVPGAASSEQADVLAVKLREVLDSEVVKVSRPVKSEELRITGLDDSTSADEVAEAVCRVGECSAEQVKCTGLRSGPRGIVTAWINCPVAAAKKLSKAGRIQVGGHVDRSTICYRCGDTGHKAGQCTAAAARCVLCAEAKRPSDHRLGSKACKTKAKKGKQARDGSEAPSLTAPAPTEAPTVEAAAMET
ncbi:actin cytoskeleton-regulatory complex protein pan1-like [Colias croceus]|uniref:actin cytoskeleton-regulatory complex protein pan1-like n=1 Tax=Colias crocea TaxID=72248 RepID=UPI001E27F8DB|nr:actin cytoskeleton-regulatory complex protein pan1-like [Colias croceus]